MLEERTVRSCRSSGSEQINLHKQLEKKHVSMGQGEKSYIQHDIFMEMSSLLEEFIQPGREGKYPF